MANQKCVIIISGGMDSVTLLHYIVKTLGNKNVTALTFDYGSRHNSYEIPCAIKQCEKLKVKHHIITLKPVFEHFESALLKHGKEQIPKGHYQDKVMKKTVVPFRNGILLSIAIGLAESIKAKYVYYGAHTGDHDIYPDCRINFIDAMNDAAEKGTYNKIQVVAPFSELTKGEILKVGLGLKVDYSTTHTCYNPSSKGACGKCGACVERLEAFSLNGKVDPIAYSI